MPILLLIGDQNALANRLLASLAARSWHVIIVPDTPRAIVALTQKPALILYAGLLDETALAGDIVRLRAAGGVAASIPIAAFAPVECAAPSDGVDVFIGSGWTPERQIAALDRWRPDAIIASLARLENVFGQDAIHALLVRFRHALEDALAMLEGDVAAEYAHRLAGLAGTLGFAAAADAWLALSEGAALDRDDLRRHTRMAIAAIDCAVAAPSVAPFAAA